jgi:hypothetical protein
MDLLTTYTHDLELQAITAPPQTSTICKSPQHPLSLLQSDVSSPTTSNSGDSSTALTKSPLHRFPYKSQSQSQSYFMTGGLSPISSSWRQAPRDSWIVIFLQLNSSGHSPYVTSSLKRGWACHSQWLPALASTVILGSKSCGTHDHILLTQIQDSPNMESQVPVFISPRHKVAQLCPKALHSLFIASYNLQGYGGGIRTRLRTGIPLQLTLSLGYNISARITQKHPI